MSSRKRSGSGHVHPQNTRSTRRRSGATSASADTEANDGGEPRSMAVSTVTMPAAGTPEVRSHCLGRRPGHDDVQAVTATQSQSASSLASALTSALTHAAPSTSGPFVQYVPGANRARHGPPHVCTVCNKSFTRSVFSANSSARRAPATTHTDHLNQTLDARHTYEHPLRSHTCVAS